jgi:hypothetical protein
MLDLHGDRRLRQEQPLRRPGEAQLLGDNPEHPQSERFHSTNLAANERECTQMGTTQNLIRVDSRSFAARNVFAYQ